MWLTGIVFLLFLLYAVLILFYTRSWKAMPEQVYERAPEKKELPSLSVIIPARNEAKNIIPLLNTIGKQTYPLHLVEVIVVDDHSTDTTAALVQQFIAENQTELTVTVNTLKHNTINSYKKKAIETGIAMAHHNWIVCTDADCMAPPHWLESMAATIIETNPVFIAAPVSLMEEPTLVNIFQNLDFLTLQGITAASVFKKIHSMCNGANLAYRKDIFYEVDGFHGIDTIASGDDMLLMHKIWKRYPQRVQYLKSKAAIIQTKAAENWNAFINQRIRWASKATTYDDKRIFAVLLVVYLFNCSFLALLIASFFNTIYLYLFLAFWIAKTAVEFPFLISVSKFFNKTHFLKRFFFFQPLHIAYTIIAGFLGSFGTYEWKERRVK